MPQVIGEAVVQVRPDLSKFDANLTRDLQNQVRPAAQAASTTIGQEMSKGGTEAGRQAGVAISSSLKTALLAGAGTVAALGIRKIISDIGAEAAEAQKVGAQTEAVLKSTGNAAGTTADEISDLAESISKKTAIDDEQIQAGENMLLTFKNVRNEAGKNNDIFDQATSISVDMAAAFAAVSGGQIDLRSASVQLGKALNDPIKGITALTRVGVTFDDQQKERIKRFVEEGNTVGAQKIILAELRSEFEGSAAAQATAADKVRVAVANVEESLGVILLPVVDAVATGVSAVADAFLSLPEPIRAVITVAGVAGGSLIVVAKAIDLVKSTALSLGPASTAFHKFFSSASAAGEGAAAGGGEAGFLGAGLIASSAAAWVTGAALIAGTAVGLSRTISGENFKISVSMRELATTTDAALSKMLVTLGKIDPQLLQGAFQKVLESDPAQAERLIGILDKAGVKTGGFRKQLNDVTKAEQESAAAAEHHRKKVDDLGGSADTVSTKFKASVSVFGEWATQVGIALGVPGKLLDELAGKADAFAKSLESSVAGSTNPFSTFSDQAEVGTEEFEQFLVGSQLAAADWVTEINSLIDRGINEGLIDQIAQAGPKSKPALDALVRAADEKGVDWINSVTHSSDEVVRKTEEAYNRLIVTEAIKGAEQRALRKAIQLDIEGDTNSHLLALTTNSDTALAQMAQNALTQFRIIKEGADGLPTSHEFDFLIAIKAFNGSPGSLSGLAALGGGDAIFQQLLDFLDGLPGQMAGGSFSGWSWVGERGPELINVGSSTATVLPSDVSLALASGQQAAIAAAPSIDNSITFGDVVMPVMRNESDGARELFRRVDNARFLAGMG